MMKKVFAMVKPDELFDMMMELHDDEWLDVGYHPDGGDVFDDVISWHGVTPLRRICENFDCEELVFLFCHYGGGVYMFTAELDDDFNEKLTEFLNDIDLINEDGMVAVEYVGNPVKTSQERV